MTETAKGDTRERLLEAAANLIAAAPGEEFSLRAVCDQVGVKMPTLYHFFGSKSGLIEAVIERGFDLYLTQKSAQEHTGDPIRDLRLGWDAHVRFGLTNPGFYTLMYGKVRPGYSPAAQSRPSELLLELTERAAEQGRLVVPPQQAASHVLVANIGVTLRQIVLAEEDRPLSVAVREGAIAAITGTASTSTPETEHVDIRRVIELAAARPDILGASETRLMTEWLQRLSSASGALPR
ncbi:TetR/AcrR family transcriptional regulator [Microbacteriaceae bacterium VKM Ac-2854]|nr:TetR/AcrR family transcriptional regulator [Microbacteriaceae bacterium VKM Ac-2854]